jgi:hypothetical protein
MIRLTEWKWLVACGTLAAGVANSDPSTSVAAPVAQTSPERDCAVPTESSAFARFETGTTFMLTDNGLVVLKQAAKKWYTPAKSDEPEFPNTGN